MTEADEGRQGQVVTFYSFKGGTGRTMSLANVAWILAANGKRVLVADWDLESPGLHRFYHPFIAEDIRNVTGVIDMIRDFHRGAQRQSPDEPEHGEPAPDDAPAEAEHAAARAEAERAGMREYIRDSARVQRYAFSLDWDFPDEGTLDFLSAGLQNNDYVATLGAMDWDTFLVRFNGAPFFDELRADMKRNYDYVLIDSRTGLSDIAHICTIHLPDVLVDCFTLSIQGIEGGAQVARTAHDLYWSRGIRVLPVPMRLDTAEKEKLDAGHALAVRRFEGLPSGMTDQERREYWAEVRVPYQAFYAFEETLAVFGDQPHTPSSLLAAFERLTSYITEGQVTGLPPMSEATRVRTMQRFTRRRPVEIDEVVLDYVLEDQVWAEWITTVLVGAGVLVRDPRESTGPARYDDDSREPRTLAVVSPAYADSVIGRSLGDFDTLAVYVSEMQPLPRFAGATWATLAGANEREARTKLLHLFDIPENPVEETSPGPDVRYPGTEPRIFNPPTRNLRFTGREDDLRQLRDELRAQGTAVVLQPVALHGLGGVGKTQVALEYAHRYKSDYDLIWWVDCEQSQYVDASLVDLGWRLREKFGAGPTTGATGAEVAQVVVRLLGQERAFSRWLLVFDNADEVETIRDFLPKGNGHVLITSRNREWEREATSLGIDVFNRADSVRHLMRRAQWLSAVEADRIAEAMGDLPLAVATAGAWLEETRMPVEVYLEELERRGPRTLSVGLRGDEQSVAGTWDLSLDRLRERSPVAYRLFEMCSVLAPDISFDLLYSNEMATVLARTDPSLTSEPTLIARVVQEINRLALIKLDPKGRQIRVHRLVQAVVRSRMTPEHADAIRQDVQRVLASARPAAEVDDPVTWDRYRVIWPHLEISGALVSTHESVRQLMLDRVRYLWQRADFEGGLELVEQVEAAWRPLEGAEPQLRRLLFLKANLLRSLGRFNESIRYDQSVLEWQQAMVGEDHPHTLMTAGSMAADLRGLGRYQEALTLDLATHKRWTEEYGGDYERTLAASNNLALSYRLTGNIEAARKLDEDTHNRRRMVLGPEHPRTLDSGIALARDFIEAGGYAAAVDQLEEIQANTVRRLGADSLEALTARALLGVALRAGGRFEESAQALKASVEGAEHRFGSSSGTTLGFRLSHGVTLLVLGRITEAAAIFREAMAYHRRNLGQDHPHTLICLVDLASALRESGDFTEAFDLARSAADRLTATLGIRHPYTLAAATVAAVALADQDLLEGSRELDESTAERLMQTLGPRHPDTLRCRANLLLTLGSLGDPGAASERSRVVTDLARALGEDHPTVVAVRQDRRLLRVIDPQPF